MFAYNLWMSCLRPDTTCQYDCVLCQHCNEQQFRNTVICSLHYVNFSVIKLDLCIRALLLIYLVSHPIAGGLSLYVVLLKKQVGVLSPLLFNIYLAKLLLKLEAQ